MSQSLNRQSQMAGAGSTNRYGDHSGSAWRANQLRPDAVPVARAQVPTTHTAASSFFNRSTTFQGNAFDASCPLRNHDHTHADFSGDDRRSAALGNNKEVFDIHASNITPRLSKIVASSEFHMLANGFVIDVMRTIEEIRHGRLLELIDECGSVQTVAEKMTRSHSQISQLKTLSKHGSTGKARSIGSDLAREFEQRFGKPRGWMDNEADPRPQPEPLLDAARQIAQVMLTADRTTRELAARILPDLALRPEEHNETLQMLARITGALGLPVQSQHQDMPDQKLALKKQA